jgi:hypothetical protein
MLFDGSGEKFNCAGLLLLPSMGEFERYAAIPTGAETPIRVAVARFPKGVPRPSPEADPSASKTS